MDFVFWFTNENISDDAVQDYLKYELFYEMLEDTNGLIRHRIWKKDKQYYGKAKENNNKKRQTIFDGTLHWKLKVMLAF